VAWHVSVGIFPRPSKRFAFFLPPPAKVSQWDMGDNMSAGSHDCGAKAPGDRGISSLVAGFDRFFLILVLLESMG
jgi:hypothetical protein